MANANKLGKDSDARSGAPGIKRMAVLAGLIIGVATPLTVLAQTAAPDSARPDTVKPAVSIEAKPATKQEQQAVVRMARFSFVQGHVLFRTDSSGEWTDATLNMPLREGAQITTDPDARAEIQFDDGSTLRLTDSAVFTLKSLYSDTDGEFTELSMKDGTATLRTLNPYSIYQIDTPDGDVKVSGAAKVRLDASSYLKVGVEDGKATLSGLDGEFKLQTGDLAEIKPDQQGPEIEDLPAPDDWDQFCDSRDSAMAPSDVHMPNDVALDAGNLSQYGNWETDTDYGDVWYPSDQTADWQPYANGNWVWFQPVGWTWVSVEAWGWAPYHYGTWIHRPHGWAWVPGPKHQPWSPAKVWFTTSGTHVIWTPLAPCEVHYEPVEVAFRHGDWGRYFSIGAAGVYFAAAPDYVAVKAWDSVALNKAQPDLARLPDKPRPIDHAFRPHNARYGAVEATLTGFVSGKGFVALRNDSLGLFVHGSTLVLGGSGPISGPGNLRPTQAATSPTRRFTDNPVYAARLDRAVYTAHANASHVEVSTVAHTASSPAGQKVLRPHADWNSSSSAEAAERARRELSYAAPSSTRPLADTVVRHTYNPTNTSENGGYGGSSTYSSHMHQWGENAHPRQTSADRSFGSNAVAPMRNEPMNRTPQSMGQGRPMMERPQGQAPVRSEPPRQQSPPRKSAPPPGNTNRH